MGTLAFNFNMLKTVEYWGWEKEIIPALRGGQSGQSLHGGGGIKTKLFLKCFLNEMGFNIDTTEQRIVNDGGKNPLKILAALHDSKINSEFMRFLGNAKSELEGSVNLIKGFNILSEIAKNIEDNEHLGQGSSEEEDQIRHKCQNMAEMCRKIPEPDNSVVEKETGRFIPGAREDVVVFKEEIEKLRTKILVNGKCLIELDQDHNQKEVEQVSTIAEDWKKGIEQHYEFKDAGNLGAGWYLKPGVEQAIFEYLYSPQYYKGVTEEGTNFDLSCESRENKRTIIKATVVRIFLMNLADIIDNRKSEPLNIVTVEQKCAAQKQARVPINMVVIELVIKKFIQTMIFLNASKTIFDGFDNTADAINKLNAEDSIQMRCYTNVFSAEIKEIASKREQVFVEDCCEPFFIMLRKQKEMFHNQRLTSVAMRMGIGTNDGRDDDVKQQFRRQQVKEILENNICVAENLRIGLEKFNEVQGGAKKTKRKKRRKHKTKKRKYKTKRTRRIKRVKRKTRRK